VAEPLPIDLHSTFGISGACLWLFKAGIDTLGPSSSRFGCASIPIPALRKMREERGAGDSIFAKRNQNHLEGLATTRFPERFEAAYLNDGLRSAG
jgi:hypothetical protein